MIMQNWTCRRPKAPAFELTPTLSALAPFRDQAARAERARLHAARPDRPGGAHAQGEHAVPHRRLAADERDAGSTPASRWIRSWRNETRPADAAGVARAGDRVERDGRRLRRRLRLRLHQHDLAGAARTRRCRWRTTRARCSSGCSATAAAPIRRRGWRACASSAACSTRSARKWRDLQGRLPQRRSRQAHRVSRRRSRRRAAHPEGRGAERTGSCRSSISPAGIPATFDEHVKLMFDLQVLAYQCDLTRVITFMLGREFSGMTYPQIGVPDAHHPISHHQHEPEKIAKVAKINAYHVQLFAYLLEEAPVDARRRRLAARSHDADVRRRHGRQQRHSPHQHADRAGGRRRRPARRAAATSAIRRTRRWRTCT